MFQVARTSAYAGGCLEPDPHRYIWIIWGGRGIRRHFAGSSALEGFTWQDPPPDLLILPCNQSLTLNQSFDMDARCPGECPYYAMDQRHGVSSCRASCVVASQCVIYNPDAPVPDQAAGTCRGALVDGCYRPKLDGTDTCLECAAWYRQTPAGKCELEYLWVIYLVAALLGCLLLALLAYLVELHWRPATNMVGLDCGLGARSQQKYRDQNRELWPLSTNLCRTEVGGPGLLLHFNFMAVVVIWAVALGLGWVLLAYMVDTQLLVLGRKPYGTAYRNCVLVAWGYTVQQRLMRAKLLYLALAYLVTFLGCLYHGLRQRRLFKESNAQDTMKAFAALVKGLPPISAGDADLESQLAHVVVSLTGQSVIGASVCWNFGHIKGQVEELLCTADVATEDTGSHGRGRLRQAIFDAEQMMLKTLEGSKETVEEGAVELLHSVQSSAEAYLIFETRSGRDKALSTLSRGFSFRGNHLSMAVARHEPRSIQWQNYDRSPHSLKWWKISKGIGCIIFGLIVWACIFYLPYAWSIFTFNYEGGRQPGIIYSLSFSIIVVVGNVSMYQICAAVADHVGFKYKETREACYMILYFISITLNVLLDLVMTYFISFAIMVHLGFRTHDGIPLTKLPYFVQRFEAYAIQRAMGQNLYDYAFPSTFQLPFLGEPVMAVCGLLRLGILVVRSHPELSQRAAMVLLAAPDFEFGRYADTLVNVVLAVTMFFFPGGYTHWIFFMLAVSQAYIYLLDHYRVLRVVPASTFASMQIDWWCQVLLAPCCGLLAACLIFKGNCQGLGFCLDPSRLVLACMAAWLVHCVIHLLLLIFVVPLGDTSLPVKGQDPIRYQQVAAAEPCNWFSANAVHCLRSKYIHCDDPSSSFFTPGQESTMQINEAIGCFFSAKAAKVENASDFDIRLPAALSRWNCALPAATFWKKAEDGTSDPPS